MSLFKKKEAMAIDGPSLIFAKHYFAERIKDRYDIYSVTEALDGRGAFFEVHSAEDATMLMHVFDKYVDAKATTITPKRGRKS